MKFRRSILRFVDRLKGKDGRIAPRWWWTGGGIAIVFIAMVVSGTFWSIVAFSGLAALLVGIFAAVRGSARLFRVRSQAAGRMLAVVGVVVLMIGSSANAATGPQSTSPVAADVKLPPAVVEVQQTPIPTPTPTPTPVESQAEVQEVAAIPFEAATVNDSGIDVGTSAVTSPGQNGTKTTTYLVDYVDGVEVSRSLVREDVTLPPISEITSIGTRQPPPPPVAAPVNNCNSNYADACVPNASDVDCAGGSGNGPAYVNGPLRVVGADVYDLDRDGDGIACDK